MKLLLELRNRLWALVLQRPLAVELLEDRRAEAGIATAD